MPSKIFELSVLLLVGTCCGRPQNFIDSFSSSNFNDGAYVQGGATFIDGGSNIVDGGVSSGFVGGTSFVGGGSSGGEFISLRSGSCPLGQAKDSNGNCIAAGRVTKSIHRYGAPPAQSRTVNPAGPVPAPAIHYNYVFIKAPKTEGRANHIVAPADQQKTVVYVLEESAGSEDQQVLRANSQINEPEVVFVRHDGDGSANNRELPGGINLGTALREAEKNGQFLDLSSQGSGGFSTSGGVSSSGVFSTSSGNSFGGQFFGGNNGGQLFSNSGRRFV